MPSPLQEKEKFQVVSTCFSKLAAWKTFHNQWQTNAQQVTLAWANYQDIITPILNENEEMDRK
jgi:hypothetical protein